MIHVKTKVSQDQPTVQIDPIEQEEVDDATNDQEVDNSSEATQDALEIEITSKMLVEEMGDVGKKKDDGKEDEKDKKGVGKEKSEEKTENSLATMIGVTILDKGK